MSNGATLKKDEKCTLFHTLVPKIHFNIMQMCTSRFSKCPHLDRIILSRKTPLSAKGQFVDLPACLS